MLTTSARPPWPTPPAPLTKDVVEMQVSESCLACRSFNDYDRCRFCCASLASAHTYHATESLAPRSPGAKTEPMPASSHIQRGDVAADACSGVRLGRSPFPQVCSNPSDSNTAAL